MSVGGLAIPQTASLLTILSNSKKLFFSPLSFHKEQFLSCGVFSGISCSMKFSETNRFYCIKDCGSQDKSFGDIHLKGSLGSNYHFVTFYGCDKKVRKIFVKMRFDNKLKMYFRFCFGILLFVS